jgi:hypothetical protein
MSAGGKTLTESTDGSRIGREIPLWFWILVPLLAIGLMLALFAFGNPLSLFTADLPPIEDLTIERIRVVEGGF